MKKLLLALVCLFSLGIGLVAQEPIKTWSTTTPPAATVIGATYGNATSTATTIYYWVVSTYTSGSVIYPYPVMVTGITSGDPQVAHPITISWNPITGPIGYSVVETTTTDQPSFPCGACLVGTVASSVTQFSDVGAGYTAFAPTMLKPATGDIRLNNTGYPSPAFEYTINGVTGPLETISCIGTPGNTVGIYRTQCQSSGATPVVYACKNTAGCTVASDWYALAGSGTFIPLSGDATSAANGGATTVLKVNGTSISASSAIGQIPVTTGATAAGWTITPTLGNPGTSTGTWTFGNATGTGTFTVGASPTTTTNTMLGFAAAPTTAHVIDVTVAGSVETLHDSGIATATVLKATTPAIHSVMLGAGTQTLGTLGPDASTTKALFAAGASADPAFRAIANADLPAANVITPGATPTLVGPKAIAICTGTCTVSVPVPVAGYEFCVYNDDNVSTAITLSALGSSAMYENSARTAYGTPTTGTLVVAAAAADFVCIVGRDSTHYLTVRSSGAITIN